MAIFATGGHFLAETFLQHRFRKSPIRRRFARLLSVTTPLAELIDELNAFRPAFLGSYPSVWTFWPENRTPDAWRSRLPSRSASSSQHLGALVKARLMRQWDCQVWDSYNATEAMPLTIPCALGRFHVNADWMILEPVDADRRPYSSAHRPLRPSSRTSPTTFEPIIRYELGDSVTLSAQRCRVRKPFLIVTLSSGRATCCGSPGRTGQAWTSRPWRWGASSRKP